MKYLLVLLLLSGCSSNEDRPEEVDVDYLSYPWLCDEIGGDFYPILLDCTNLSDNSHVDSIRNATNILEVK